ncbi:hypothetical protein BMMON2_52210 [Burkholderia mallei]
MSHVAPSGPSASELDVFACPLDGVNQIEASAGTGKTWNICALYVRLLLEKDLGADEILVVTFTKAATAELHERIRARLAQLAHALDTGDDGGDPFIARLFETTLAPERGLDPQTAAKRVRRALRAFDQAAIHTIHAFCQRALQEAPFAAAMPFAFEMEADDGALRFELAADFWRTRVEPVAAAYPAFAEWLVEYGAGPAALDAQLARRLKKPLARLRWDGLHAADDGAESAARAHFDTAAAIWRDERGVLGTLLADAQPSLNQRSHKPEAVSEALDAWARYFEQASAVAALPRAALKLTQSALEKATKKGGATPRHAFFDVAQALEAAVAALEAAQRARWLSLVEQWLDAAPAELAQRKRTRRVVSFDDLLANLYRALDAHPWLRETLRARYPAALIDEFQDTDPLQFAIFDTIFAPAGPLFLVGDPKQAIYSFRAADLHTYLAARARASARYTLAVNQRSTPAIVDACNRVFGANPRAFVLDGLDYEPVRAGSRVRAPLVDATDPLAGAGDFRIWTLPAGDDVLTKRDAQRHAAHACAAEIARLMRGARERAVTLGGEPLAASGIAVLVQTHRQGSLVKRVLAAWGIGSVELAQASVFATIDAEQLERVLAAIDAPGDLRRLRSALASDWFGLDAAALWRLEQGDAEQDGIDAAARGASGNGGGARAASAGAPAPSPADADAMGWVERFSRYRLLWRERGFAVMWRTLAGELRIAERLMAGADGERRVTDVNHLAELTQARASAQPGIAPTLRWLAAQRLEGGGDDAQLRLESDRNLVQIVTVHKSKGLEYAIVFCPFLNDGGLREPAGSGLPDAREYHDESGCAVLHYGCDDEAAERASREAVREQAAERARLVYVALTRAVYRCYLVAGTYQSSRSTKEARRSVLNWLVAGAGRDFDAWLKEPPEDAELAERWQALAGGPVTLGALPVPAHREPLAAGHDAQATRAARRATRGLRDAWRIASFSSLASAIARDESGIARAADDEMRPDHDALAAALGADALEPPDAAAAIAPAPAAPRELAEDDILAFPRGAAAGECLHRLLELSNFADASTWPPAALRALHERPVEAELALAERLPAMMTRLVADLAATELVPGMRLAALDPARRLTEMEFLFPAPALDFNALRRLLAAHGYPDVALEAGTLAGFVKGFIDMIVEHDGRFWIVDWKSNHLGTTPEAYGERALDAAMAHHAYHLQALLYMVALHRYLRVRMRGYDYDAHIAGYLYVFVRGVRPDWRNGGASAGVHARRPARALIEALDALMREGMHERGRRTFRVDGRPGGPSARAGRFRARARRRLRAPDRDAVAACRRERRGRALGGTRGVRREPRDGGGARMRRAARARAARRRAVRRRTRGARRERRDRVRWHRARRRVPTRRRSRWSAVSRALLRIRDAARERARRAEPMRRRAGGRRRCALARRARRAARPLFRAAEGAGRRLAARCGPHRAHGPRDDRERRAGHRQDDDGRRRDRVPARCASGLADRACRAHRQGRAADAGGAARARRQPAGGTRGAPAAHVLHAAPAAGRWPGRALRAPPRQSAAVRSRRRRRGFDDRRRARRAFARRARAERAPRAARRQGSARGRRGGRGVRRAERASRVQPGDVRDDRAHARRRRGRVRGGAAGRVRRAGGRRGARGGRACGSGRYGRGRARDGRRRSCGRTNDRGRSRTNDHGRSRGDGGRAGIRRATRAGAARGPARRRARIESDRRRCAGIVVRVRRRRIRWGHVGRRAGGRRARCREARWRGAEPRRAARRASGRRRIARRRAQPARCVRRACPVGFGGCFRPGKRRARVRAGGRSRPGRFAGGRVFRRAGRVDRSGRTRVARQRGLFVLRRRFGECRSRRAAKRRGDGDRRGRAHRAAGCAGSDGADAARDRAIGRFRRRAADRLRRLA